MAGSLAVMEDSRLLSEIELDPTQRTARTLVPAMRNLLQRAGWGPSDLNLVVVASGPGSFTGLRIGVTSAKTFAYATGASVLGVNTLAVIASQSRPTASRLWSIMSAERGQLFAAAFRRHDSGWTEAESTRIHGCQDWLSRLTNETAVTGPGLTGITSRIPAGVEIVSESQWRPRASSVATEGWRAYCEGRRADCWSLVPCYFRESAAMEKAGTAAG